MNAIHLFGLQFLLSLLAWSAIAGLLIAPHLRACPRATALSVLLVPQMFRHIGVTLLVPGVAAAEMPRDFAMSVAVGDSITALLALLSFVSLRKNRPYAITFVWLTNVVGLGDILHILWQGARLRPVEYLHAAWVVPTFLVPLMIVSHVMIFVTLIRRADHFS